MYRHLPLVLQIVETMESAVSEAHVGQTREDRPLHVLIIGAGIIGLTLAQGCRENGIPYSLFERDTEGWLAHSHVSPLSGTNMMSRKP